MKNQSGNIVIQVLLGIVFLFALAFGIWALSSWKKVPAGNVGVHVYLMGGEKGVDAVTRGVGRHWIGWQQELYLYPTFTQNHAYKKQGLDGDTSIEFSDVDGTKINADVSISYNVDPTKADDLFQKYRLGIEEITNVVLRQKVQEALNEEASVLKVEQIYGKGREALIAKVRDRVRAAVSPFGIRVETVSWVGAPRLPPIVADALVAKIGATQKAQQRENEVRQAEAEAAKAVAEAKGVADSQLLRAKAEAESIQIRGEALRNNPALVDLTIAEKWNGQYPSTLIIGQDGGNLLQVPLGK